MKKYIFYFLGVIAALLVGLFIIRFSVGGGEDSWICQNHQWIKHGQPLAPRPRIPCLK